MLIVSSGLDSRYLISQIKHNDFRVASLTTVASPHRGIARSIRFEETFINFRTGSSFADYIFREIGGKYTVSVLAHS